MRYKWFRVCMLVGAGALGAVALHYFINYALLSIALNNSALRPNLQASIRGLWLSFACQALLIGVLCALVAFRPKSVSREVIVLFGLLQLVEAVLLFLFADHNLIAYMLVAAAAFVLAGSILWPKNWTPPPKPVAAPATPAVRPADADTEAMQHRPPPGI